MKQSANRMYSDTSRSSKVVDFGTNRKRVGDFRLVSIVTLVLSCLVSEICAPKAIFVDTTLFRSKIQGVPLGSAENEHPRLSNREIIFEEFQFTIHQRYRRSDGQIIYHWNTALHVVSRAKKRDDWAGGMKKLLDPNLRLSRKYWNVIMSWCNWSSIIPTLEISKLTTKLCTTLFCECENFAWQWREHSDATQRWMHRTCAIRR